MSAEIEQVTLAVTAINKVETGLAALREQFSGVVFDVTTASGMESARTARRAVREPRLEVERIRKAAKAPILALGKQLDSTAARITAELEKIEGPIDQQIKAREKQIEDEKQARIDAELKRVADLQEAVAYLRGNPMLTPASGSKLIAEHIADLEGMTVDAAYQEFEPQAHEAKSAGLDRLRALHAAALAHEAEQERLKAEREELARLRAEQVERDRIAREAQAKADAEAEAERDRLAEEERQRQVAAAREHAQKLAAERAENDRTARERQAELDAQAEAQRLANAAEAGRIAAAREALEREQAALREAQKPKAEKPRIKGVPMPSRDELVDVVAQGFNVDRPTALYWLMSFRSEEAA